LRAFTGSQALILTDKEFEILRYLAEHAGKIVSRDELLHLVWGYESTPVTRTVDNFIFRLRQKIEPDPRHPRFIQTVYGDGYRLTIPG
jgi:DNA-binding response OmpR family regulator